MTFFTLTFFTCDFSSVTFLPGFQQYRASPLQPIPPFPQPFNTVSPTPFFSPRDRQLTSINSLHPVTPSAHKQHFPSPFKTTNPSTALLFTPSDHQHNISTSHHSGISSPDQTTSNTSFPSHSDPVTPHKTTSPYVYSNNNGKNKST